MPRKTLGERDLPIYDHPVDLKITTRAPGKWVFADVETGDLWVHQSGAGLPIGYRYRKATPEEIQELKLAIEKVEKRNENSQNL